LFSSAYHPQTDSKTEVTNRTLSTLLHVLIKRNMKEWEECLPIAECAYNRARHSTTGKSPFEVVYDFNLLSPLDILPLLLQEHTNNKAYKIDNPRDKYSMSDIFNINDLSPYHGDEDFDPSSDLSQGRGDDVEHPSVIPVDLPSYHQVPRGPITRARVELSTPR